MPVTVSVSMVIAEQTDAAAVRGMRVVLGAAVVSARTAVSVSVRVVMVVNLHRLVSTAVLLCVLLSMAVMITVSLSLFEIDREIAKRLVSDILDRQHRLELV